MSTIKKDDIKSIESNEVNNIVKIDSIGNTSNEILAKRVKPTKIFVGTILFFVLSLLIITLAILMYIRGFHLISVGVQKEMMQGYNMLSSAFNVLSLAAFIITMGILNLIKMKKNNDLYENHIPCIERNAEGKLILHVTKGEDVILDDSQIIKINNNLIYHKRRTNVYYVVDNDENKYCARIGYVAKEDYLKLKEKFNKKTAED